MLATGEVALCKQQVLPQTHSIEGDFPLQWAGVIGGHFSTILEHKRNMRAAPAHLHPESWCPAGIGRVFIMD